MVPEGINPGSPGPQRPRDDSRCVYEVSCRVRAKSYPKRTNPLFTPKTGSPVRTLAGPIRRVGDSTNCFYYTSNCGFLHRVGPIFRRSGAEVRLRGFLEPED